MMPNPLLPEPRLFQALHYYFFSSLITAFSFQTNSSAIIDRIFASEGVVNSAIPAYHLRDLIKRYLYCIYEMLLKDVPCEVLCLALGNLEPTPTTLFFIALVTVLVTSASVSCVGTSHQ